MAEYEFTFKIVLVGEASLGKSYFTRNFCHNLFRSDTKMTIGVDFLVRNITTLGKNIKLPQSLYSIQYITVYPTMKSGNIYIHRNHI